MFRNVFLLLLIFLCVYAKAGTLDSLRKVYEHAGLTERIRLIKELNTNGEKKEKLRKHFTKLRIEVDAQGSDSLRYHLLEAEAEFSLFSGNSGEGLSKLIECLSYYEKKGNKAMASELAYKIARYYFYTSDLKRSLKYIRLSLSFADEKKQQKRVATAQMVMGVIYQNMKMNDSALFYQEQALEFKKKNKMLLDLPVSYNNIAELYLEIHQPEKAMATVDHAIHLSDSLKIDHALAYAQHVKGNIYNTQRNYKEALAWLLPASLFWERRKSYEDLFSSYKQLTYAYEGSGNYKKALEYERLHKAMSDTLMNAEKQKNAGDLESKYQNEKDALIIARQKAENDTVETQKKNQLTIFILVAVFLVINAFVFYSRYRKQKKDKQLIAEQKAEAVLQGEIIAQKQKEIIDSIHYAKRIQQALMPSEKYIERVMDKLKK